MESISARTAALRNSLQRLDRIAVRIALIAAIPLIVLSYFGLREIHNQNRTAAEATRSVEAIETLRLLSDLRVNLGGEAVIQADMARLKNASRNTEVLALAASIGFDLEREVTRSQERVDSSLARFTDEEDSAELASSIEASLSGLPDIRAAVLAGEATVASVDEYFGSRLALLDDHQRIELDQMVDGPLDRDTQRYAALLEATTRAQEALRDAANLVLSSALGEQLPLDDFIRSATLTADAERRLLDSLDTDLATRYVAHMAELSTSRNQAAQQLAAAFRQTTEWTAAVDAAGDLAAFAISVNQMGQFVPIFGDDVAARGMAASEAAESSAQRNTAVLLATAVLTGALLVAAVAAVSRPVRALGLASASMTEGRGVAALPVRGPYEVAAASASFNAMAETITVIEQQARALADGQLDDPVLRAPVRGSIGDSLNLTVRRLTESTTRLHQQATTDHLTALPNRGAVLDLLSDQLDPEQHGDGEVALLFLDIDRFKQINDVHGHGAGDVLLYQFADRLQAVAGPSMTPARLGGDEFVAVVTCDPSTDCETLALLYAERIHSAISPQFDLGSGGIWISASVGISTGRRGEVVVERMLSEASTAMKAAKMGSDTGIALYDEAMRRSHVALTELHRGIERAVENGELKLHLQPIVDSTRSRVVSAEALVRWDRDGEIVPAADFIHAVEASGLIEQIDDWVFQEACRTIARWQSSTDDPGLTLSVNVSAASLRRGHYTAGIAASLERHGVDPGRLCLELTETRLLDDVDAAIRQLDQIRSLGLRIALDDFGTGYSSLTYLRQLPADFVKIDRSFVSQLPHEADKRIVEMIIGIARQLDLVVIAEGVETDDQLAQLEDLGCRYMQGWLFAKAMPDEAFDAWCSRWNGQAAVSTSV